MKIDLRGVSETLLVTLYMRAKDAKSNHPFLNDQKAAEIISRMDYDFSAFECIRSFTNTGNDIIIRTPYLKLTMATNTLNK